MIQRFFSSIVCSQPVNDPTGWYNGPITASALSFSAISIELSEIKRQQFYKFNTGRIEKVIFESRNIEGKMFGFTSNYIKVEAPFCKELIGKVVDVKLTNTTLKGNFDVEFMREKSILN